jgi:hypothetical protein
MSAKQNKPAKQLTREEREKLITDWINGKGNNNYTISERKGKFSIKSKKINKKVNIEDLAALRHENSKEFADSENENESENNESEHFEESDVKKKRPDPNLSGNVDHKCNPKIISKTNEDSEDSETLEPSQVRKRQRIQTYKKSDCEDKSSKRIGQQTDSNAEFHLEHHANAELLHINNKILKQLKILGEENERRRKKKEIKEQVKFQMSKPKKGIPTIFPENGDRQSRADSSDIVPDNELDANAGQPIYVRRRVNPALISGY